MGAACVAAGRDPSGGLSLIVLRGRGEASKDVELALLRHEISVLRRQLRRPRLEPSVRLITATFARHLPVLLR